MASKSNVILVIGAGHCGLGALEKIMELQPDTQINSRAFTLPWLATEATVQARLKRLSSTQSRFTVDIATSLLPHIERVVDTPNIKVACLKRSLEEVSERFIDSLESEPIPLNHWSTKPEPGTYHHPVKSRLYPKYEISDVKQCITKYWNDYYQKAEELANSFPDIVRIFDADTFSSSESLGQFLEFLGYEAQTPNLTSEASSVPYSKPPPASRSQTNHPSRCAILVPYSGYIHRGCDQALTALEERGYVVRRVSGYAAIDQGRSQMATDALLDGFEETMWIDSDIEFHPNAVEILRSHNLPISCGIYPKKGQQEIACHVLPGCEKISFGRSGGLCELLYAATGFLHIRREVYQTIQSDLSLPICNEKFGRPMIPFFLPIIKEQEEGSWYLAEDFSFSDRAKQCGYKIVADSRLRIWHLGQCRYGWEDAGIAKKIYKDFSLEFH